MSAKKNGEKLRSTKKNGENVMYPFDFIKPGEQVYLIGGAFLGIEARVRHIDD